MCLNIKICNFFISNWTNISNLHPFKVVAARRCIFPQLSCLASPANFIYGRVEAKVLSHVTFMPVLLRPVNNFLGQVGGNASGNTILWTTLHPGKWPFKNVWIRGLPYLSKNSNKSQTFATGPYQRLHEARPRHVVWLWEPEYQLPWPVLLQVWLIVASSICELSKLKGALLR